MRYDQGNTCIGEDMMYFQKRPAEIFCDLLQIWGHDSSDGHEQITPDTQKTNRKKVKAQGRGKKHDQRDRCKKGDDKNDEDIS